MNMISEKLGFGTHWTCAGAILLLLGGPASAEVVINLEPDTGEVSSQPPDKVVSVDPNSTTTFRATTTGTSALYGFQLNFGNSDVEDGQLDLHNWLTDGSWGLPFDSDFIPDWVVAASDFSGVNSPVAFGTFDVVAPDTPGDYLLTLDNRDAVSGTILNDGTTTAPTISDYGDVLVRVVPEPTSVALLAIAFASSLVSMLRRRHRRREPTT